MRREDEVRTFNVAGAPEERAFILEIQFRSGGRIRLKIGQLMDAISRLFVWQGKAAESVTILDSEETVVVSSWTTIRMWEAASKFHSRPTNSAPYTVRGSAGGNIEEHPSRSLKEAITIAISWFADGSCKPDWAHVVGPNGRVVLSHRELWRMHCADARSRGEPMPKRVRRRVAA